MSLALPSGEVSPLCLWLGAVIRKRGIPTPWTRGFDDIIHSYLIDRRRFSIRNVLSRFEKQARLVHAHLPA